MCLKNVFHIKFAITFNWCCCLSFFINGVFQFCPCFNHYLSNCNEMECYPISINLPAEFLMVRSNTYRVKKFHVWGIAKHSGTYKLKMNFFSNDSIISTSTSRIIASHLLIVLLLVTFWKIHWGCRFFFFFLREEIKVEET